MTGVDAWSIAVAVLTTLGGRSLTCCRVSTASCRHAGRDAAPIPIALEPLGMRRSRTRLRQFGRLTKSRRPSNAGSGLQLAVRKLCRPCSWLTEPAFKRVRRALLLRDSGMRLACARALLARLPRALDLARALSFCLHN